MDVRVVNRAEELAILDADTISAGLWQQEKQRVLYMDENLADCQLFEMDLRFHFEILTCQRPLEALSLIASDNIRIVILAETEGKRVSREQVRMIKEIHSDTTCLVLSQSVNSEILAQDGVDCAIFPKPYDRSALINFIKSGML